MVEGLFRDDTAIRRVTGEAAVLGGAAYAILLQVAHPSVGRGVREHSDFTSRPVNRLRGTLTFVYGTVFGTRAEADRIAAIVRAMHTKVAGPGYHGLDPDLQVWVAATLYAGAVRFHELAMGPMPDGEKDELYAQSAVFATALGCPADSWPASRAAFDRYWAGMVDSIEVPPEGREIAAELFAPANPLLRPAVRAQRFLAAGVLPPRLREGFGIAWGPRQQRRFDRLGRVLRVVYPRLPRPVRTLPKNAYMRDMRRQAARNRLYRRPGRRSRSAVRLWWGGRTRPPLRRAPTPGGGRRSE
ncbi:uncharacterized protein (DUF2236 family) [Haloactinospora alba]|uniref:Uncharacterized protein (DUF2236 family) n=1 Tax=Haloactinospora alba TaxID=405555 RepID=A0A543NEK4_9ACTN|nr:oxygenase MpaB family protein [Haloactinospora alba]TQN30170.1 uncharacterized protein (DUF2236 family) [Haloactinospora alba]